MRLKELSIVLACVLSSSCQLSERPYRLAVPANQIPRLQNTSGREGEMIQDVLCGGFKQYIVWVNKGESLDVSPTPRDGSVRVNIINMQTGQGAHDLDELEREAIDGIGSGLSNDTASGHYLIVVYGKKDQPFTLRVRTQPSSRYEGSNQNTNVGN
jgi:hypothetical protein